MNRQFIMLNRIRSYYLYCLLSVGLFIYSSLGLHSQPKPPVQYTYIDDTPMPLLTDKMLSDGFVVFRTNYLNIIMRETIPGVEDINQPLRAFASLGEYEPVSFAVRTLKDLTDIRVQVSSLKGPGISVIGQDRIDVRSARFMLEMLWSRDKRMMVSPIFLEKRNSLNMIAEQTQPYWVTIHVPEDAVPGYYHGELTVSAKGAGTVTTEIILEVLPLKLDPLPSEIALGMYDRARDQSNEELLGKFRDMKEHGMTTVGFAGNLGCNIRRVGDRVTIDFKGEGELERTMAAYKKTGMTGPFHWLMGSDVREWAIKEAGGMEKPEFSVYYRNAVKAIVDHARKNNWPYLVIQPDDEAFEHRDRWESMVRCMEALRPLVPDILIEADGMNGDSTGLRHTLPLIDVLNYHDGPFLKRGVYDGPGWTRFKAEIESLGKQIWFYNVDHSGYHPESGRFSYGFMVWENKVPGMFNWLLYKGGRKNPYAGATEPGYNYMYRFLPSGDEVGGPTTQWEATREGVDDLKYLFTWRSLADRALKSGRPELVQRVQSMETELASWLGEIDYSKWNNGPVRGKWTTTDEKNKVFRGSYKMQGVWDIERYNLMRRKIAGWILYLQKF